MPVACLIGYSLPPRLVQTGKEALHSCSPYLNSRVEQDHRGIKQRYYPTQGFGSLESATRFSHAFEEIRYWLRPRQRMTQAVSLADKRHLFVKRFAALQAMMLAA